MLEKLWHSPWHGPEFSSVLGTVPMAVFCTVGDATDWVGMATVKPVNENSPKISLILVQNCVLSTKMNLISFSGCEREEFEIYGRGQ